MQGALIIRRVVCLFLVCLDSHDRIIQCAPKYIVPYHEILFLTPTSWLLVFNINIVTITCPLQLHNYYRKKIRACIRLLRFKSSNCLFFSVEWRLRSSWHDDPIPKRGKQGNAGSRWTNQRKSPCHGDLWAQDSYDKICFQNGQSKNDLSQYGFVTNGMR